MDLRETFKEGLLWQVGNGLDINFWKDNWIFQTSLLELGFFKEDDINYNLNDKVSNFIDNQGKWKKEALEKILPSNIVQDISNVHLSYNNLVDKMFWGFAANGEYTNKVEIWLAHGLQKGFNEKCDYHWIWSLKLPHKKKTFLRYMCADGLATKERLNQSRIFVPQSCPICAHHTENTTHLFLDCPGFKRIWSNVKYATNSNASIPNTRDDNFVKNLYRVRKSTTQNDPSLIVFTWWAVWFKRNEKKIDDKNFVENEVVQLVKKLFTEWKNIEKINTQEIGIDTKTKQRKGDGGNTRKNVRWKPSEENNVKLNFDGSKDGDRRAGAGYCIRDHKGKLLAAWPRSNYSG